MSYTANMAVLTTDAERARDFVFDWNEVNRKGRLVPQKFALLDETLRDGLQNPSVVDPPIDDKLSILHLMEDLGIHVADIGLPGSSQARLRRRAPHLPEIVDCKMKIQVACAGRTVVADITPMIEISSAPASPSRSTPSSARARFGSSPRSGTSTLIAKRSAEAIDVAVKAGLARRVRDRGHDALAARGADDALRAAIDHGATRLCLSDTVGHATPDGVRNLIQFTKSVIAGTGAEVGIDWHGHNDRGLALENALWALEFGADRVHGTALGIGERVGNAQMELILLNLKLLGLLPADRTSRSSSSTARPSRAPSAGRCRSTTRSSAATRSARRPACTPPRSSRRCKGRRRGSPTASTAACPPGCSGASRRSAIGFMSGASNVNYWLRQRRIEPNDALVDAILRAAKETRRLMNDEEIMAIVERQSR